MKTTIQDMETGMSAWSDEEVTLQTMVNTLKTGWQSSGTNAGTWKQEYIRIIGVPETTGLSSMISVSKLLQ